MNKNYERLWITDDERYELARENNRLLRAQKEKEESELSDQEWKQIFEQTVAIDHHYNIVIS